MIFNFILIITTINTLVLLSIKYLLAASLLTNNFRKIYLQIADGSVVVQIYSKIILRLHTHTHRPNASGGDENCNQLRIRSDPNDMEADGAHNRWGAERWAIIRRQQEVRKQEALKDTPTTPCFIQNHIVGVLRLLLYGLWLRLNGDMIWIRQFYTRDCVGQTGVYIRTIR